MTKMENLTYEDRDFLSYMINEGRASIEGNQITLDKTAMIKAPKTLLKYIKPYKSEDSFSLNE